MTDLEVACLRRLMRFKSGVYGRCRHQNPPPSNRRGPKFGQCPTIRLFCCSAPRAPANALNATKLPGTTVTDRHQPAARRSRRHCRRKAGSSTFAHLTVADHSLSLPRATSRHISGPLLPLSRVPHQSYPTTPRPSLTPGIATADLLRTILAPSINRYPRSHGNLPRPSTSHEGASLVCPTHLLPSPDRLRSLHSHSGMH